MAKPDTVSNILVVNNLNAANVMKASSATITWDASTTGGIKYYIYRNFAPYGTFTKIAETTSTTYTDQYTLNSTDSSTVEGITQELDGIWYYSITAINSTSEESDKAPAISYEDNAAYNRDPFASGYTIDSQTISFAPETRCKLPKNTGMEDYFKRIRVYNLWLLLNNGQDVWYFQRRKEGTKCPYWQDDSHSCEHPLGINDNLENACYNTGLLGGYYDPVKIKLRFVSAQSKVYLDKEGFRVQNTPRAWTIWTPRIANYDFFVTSDGIRYEITNVNKVNARGGLITHQDFEIIRKWETDLIYKVPVPGPLL